MRESKVFDDPPADQVFLDNSLERRRIRVAIPDALRIDQRNRSALAHAKAVGARAVDAVEQPQFAQASFEIIPGFDSFLARAALGLGLIGAQKDVTPHGGQFQILGALGEARGRFS
jgi:hypothetical protein